MNALSGSAVVAVVGFILLRGWMSGADMYSAFLSGAEKGMRSALGLLPALCAMLMMLALVDASGLTKMLTALLSPVTDLLRIPKEAAPLLLPAHLSQSLINS